MKISKCLIAFVCLFSIDASAGQSVKLECTPEAPLASGFRVSWNTLVSIESVESDLKTGLEIKMTYLDGMDSGAKKTAVDKYLPSDTNGMFQSYRADQARSVQFSSVGLGIRDIKAPMSAGPIPEGDHTATATLVLVSEYFLTAGGDAQIDVAKVPLTCTYKVRYF